MEPGKINNKRKDDYFTKVFWISFQTIFIFSIPAFSGLFLGKILDAFYGTDRLITTILLFAAFFSSWAVVIIKYRNLVKN